ncbi:MAG TPA: aldo/keto reductase [Polyangiaceae bacterium]|nr:aldo/keto reductase [Polyangiaceae bacterium]
MEQVPFGATGLTVSRLGLGCGGLGEARVGDADAERLVLGAVDRGVTFFDAARSYGAAEERLGRILGGRDDVVVSTKGGYGASGAEDWTPAAVARGIDEACARLRRDRVDVFHLHSCPVDVLRRDDLLEALARARDAGKLRVAAYSGDNAALAWAVGSRGFGSVQCSVNVFDQHALAGSVPRAAVRGMGVVAKRPLGNAPWRFAERPAADDVAGYWERMHALALDPAPLGWAELALRFAAFAPGVSCAVVGTTSLGHLRDAAADVEKGPLGEAVTAAIAARFAAAGGDWAGRV